MGVIPKANSSSWRLITDLSSPLDVSVNDGIQSKYCSLLYVTVDEIENDARSVLLVEVHFWQKRTSNQRTA